MTEKEYLEIMDKSNFFIDSNNPYDMKIKEALEKQVAIKPIMEEKIVRHEYYDEISEEKSITNKCPVCKNMLTRYARRNDYCNRCGQKINYD